MAASNYYGFPNTSVAPPYSTPPITAYCTPATTYAVQQVPGAAQAGTPAYAPLVQAIRPIASVTYGAYPTHAADYGYGTRQPEPPPQTVTPPSYQDSYSYGHTTTATNYENKQYYQPASTQAAHTVTDSFYQTGCKDSYSQSSSGYNQPQRQVTPIKTVQTENSTASSYVVYPVITTVQQSVPTTTIPSYTPVSTYNSTPASYSGTNYTSYDPTVYSASATYYQPQQQHQQPPPPQQPPPQPSSSQQQPQKSAGATSWSNAGNRTDTNFSTSLNKKTPYQNKQLKPKGPPKQPQIHYCEICKISCAGPQTYREHLEGQKHKKKETALKSGNQITSGPRGVPTQLRCELCDVSCTGTDAYAAHIRGSKHQKVMKLHTKLGKPIPLIEPVTMDSVPDSSTTHTTTAPITMASKVLSPMTSSAPTTPAVLTVNNASCTVKPAQLIKSTTTKTTFVGSNKPQPVLAKPEPVVTKEQMKAAVSKAEFQNDNFTLDDFGDNLVGPTPSMIPIGDEFVEEVCNDEGKIKLFHCKLCECSFNDPNAKDMHLKGRRHRLQFKKKVNPQFPVEIKTNNRARKLQEEKMKKLKQKDLIRRRRDDDQRFHLERSRYEHDMYWRRVEEEKIYWEEQRRLRAPDWHPPPLMGRPGMPVPPLLVGNNFNMRGFERRDLKIQRIPRLFGVPPQCDSPHHNRRPYSFEDRYIMFKHSKIYPSEEELLAIQKLVSHSERSLKLVSDTLTEENTDKKEEDNIKEKGARDRPRRCLKGVIRVGVLSKGLLLRGDRNVKLILLSEKNPTASLLQKVAELLPNELSDLTQDKYEVSLNLKESNITIACLKEPKMKAIISIASPIMRDEETDKDEEKESYLDPPDLINKQKCMDSLAALRHAKWFQARANGLQSCVIVIRILRDLCQRVPTWSTFPDWAMELLVEMALSTVSGPLSPGDALRRVLECIASGTLLPDGPGLPDPCEKDRKDVLKSMTNQQREDITASAQHALRMVAFRQIYKVLGIEPFPHAKHKPVFYNRKRRRDTTEVDDKGDGKKEKKDDPQEG